MLPFTPEKERGNKENNNLQKLDRMILIDPYQKN